MIDMEVPVIEALENDADLSLLVGKKIFRWVVPKKYADQYPYIRVQELDNTDNDYRDNMAGSSDVDIQIDFWSKGDPAPLQNQIDSVMKLLQFKRTGVTSFFEEDTKTIRKAIRYRTKVKL